MSCETFLILAVFQTKWKIPRDVQYKLYIILKGYLSEVNGVS